MIITLSHIITIYNVHEVIETTEDDIIFLSVHGMLSDIVEYLNKGIKIVDSRCLYAIHMLTKEELK